MIRRRFVLAGCVAFTPTLASAQTQQPRRRIALLRWDTEATAAGAVSGFLARLGELGWSAGQNLDVAVAYAASDPARARAFLETAIAEGAELIVASSTPAVAAARAATRTLPIVMAPAADPVANGFVESLARPGGNMTGVTLGGAELAAKRLELIQEAMPQVKRLAFLGLSRDPAARGFASASGAAAKQLGIELRELMVADPSELAAAFATFAEERHEAVLVQPIFVFQREEVAALALRYRLPAISELDAFVRSGLLMSYGASGNSLMPLAARHVDRILRGASPGALPVELPTRIQLVVNLATARRLGIVLPASLLARADEVIE